MERLKNWSFWTQEKLDSYNLGPTYPTLMFWLITTLVLVQCALGVWMVAKYHSFLSEPLLIEVATILLMLPFTWVAYYRLHRRFKRLLKEIHTPNQRLLIEAQHLSTAIVLGTYIFFGISLSLLSRLLKLYH